MCCLENARDILLTLETEYRALFARNLTLSRLSEAVILYLPHSRPGFRQQRRNPVNPLPIVKHIVHQDDRPVKGPDGPHLVLQGRIEGDRDQELLVVDMRRPIVLTRNVETTIKAPLNANPRVL